MTATDPVQAVAQAIRNENLSMQVDLTNWPEWDEILESERRGWSDMARAALAAARPLIAAQVLREAAGSLYGDERANGDHWHPLSVASWLRERADDLEGK